jgi:small subunit ribosomal protein S21
MLRNNSREIGVCVITRESESIESLLKRFKRKVIKSDILKDCKRTTEYVKPSVEKRRKSLEARRRKIKEQLKLEKEFQKKKKRKGEKKKYEETTSS